MNDTDLQLFKGRLYTMRINNYEHQALGQVLEQMPEAAQTFYEHNISASRYSLANAAAAAGVNTDQMMAVLDYRTRRAAQRQAEAAEVAEDDLVTA
jgi:iron-sulfur cluster repair protein YtfE (RIC family)